jgi:hypothetical protein
MTLAMRNAPLSLFFFLLCFRLLMLFDRHWSNNSKTIINPALRDSEDDGDDDDGAGCVVAAIMQESDPSPPFKCIQFLTNKLTNWLMQMRVVCRANAADENKTQREQR